MTDPRVNLKNPFIAAVLAYLIPGAGHWYQGRRFKAVIYFVCIVGLFSWGCSLGEAKAVHLRWDDEPRRGRNEERQRTIGFIAQAGIGGAALPAAAQFYRARGEDALFDQEQVPGKVLEKIDANFEGFARHVTLGAGKVEGRVTGTLVVGRFGTGSEFEGRLVGKMADGRDVDWQLVGSQNAQPISLEVGRRITGLDDVTPIRLSEQRPEPEFSGSRRRFFCQVAAGVENAGLIEGSIQRPLKDHFLAPLSDNAMKHLQGRLGKYYDLALVYTWIAGLLNVLAVWDALQGPAYGYGDETDEDETPPKAEGANAGPVAAPSATTAS